MVELRQREMCHNVYYSDNLGKTHVSSEISESTPGVVSSFHFETLVEAT